MNTRQYIQQLEHLANKASDARDRSGDLEGLWQALIDAISEAYDRANDLHKEIAE